MVGGISKHSPKEEVVDKKHHLNYTESPLLLVSYFELRVMKKRVIANKDPFESAMDGTTSS